MLADLLTTTPTKEMILCPRTSAHPGWRSPEYQHPWPSPHLHHSLLLAGETGVPVSGNRGQSLGIRLLPRSPVTYPSPNPVASFQFSSHMISQHHLIWVTISFFLNNFLPGASMAPPSLLSSSGCSLTASTPITQALCLCSHLGELTQAHS